jgi:hypothetical protein
MQGKWGMMFLFSKQQFACYFEKLTLISSFVVICSSYFVFAEICICNSMVNF